MTRCNLENISVIFNLFRIQIDHVDENERAEIKIKITRKIKIIIYFSIERKNTQVERIIFDAH
jgi:hypothetical protein